MQRVFVKGLMILLGLAMIFSAAGCDRDKDNKKHNRPGMKFKNAVVVVEEEDAPETVVDQPGDNAQLPLDEFNDLGGIQVGDTIAIMKGGGLLGRVTGVTQNGDTMTVIVEDVPLTEIFDELHIQETAPPPEPIQVWPPPPGTGPDYDPNVATTIELAPGVYLDTSIVTGFSQGPDFGVDIHVGHADGWPWEWEGPHLNTFDLVVYPEVTFGFTLTVGLAANESVEEEKQIGGKKPLVMWNVYGINVWLYLEHYVGCSAEFTSDINMYAADHFTCGMDVGTHYYSGSWHNVWDEYHYNNFDYGYNLDLSGAAQCWYKPQLYVEIANLGGPYLYAKPYLEFEAVGLLAALRPPDPEADLPGLYLNLGFNAGLGGKVEILGYEFDTSREFEIWETNLWSFAADCAEEGEVECGTLASNYKTCGYFDADPWLDWSGQLSCAAGAHCTGDMGNPCGYCGDNIIEPDEVCDYSVAGSLANCHTACYDGQAQCTDFCTAAAVCDVGTQGCGNGTLEGCETCDGAPVACANGCYDGLAACTSRCELSPTCDVGAQACGNGILEGCERCDLNRKRCKDPTLLYEGFQPCQSDCSGFGTFCDIGAQACGNATREGGEVCDTVGRACVQGCYAGTQACLPNCLGHDACDIGAQTCGNGATEGCETCDGEVNVACVTPVGNYNGLKNCVANCLAWDACVPTESCGDGAINGNETCEDTFPANNGIDLGCVLATPNCAGCGVCSADVCGDGVVGASETCDDGAANGTGDGHCLITCQAVQDCGDGVANGGEVCDHGLNNGTGDGFCLSNCSAVQDCGDGVTNGTENCDDGALNGTGDPPFCVADCSYKCGDGKITGAEIADPVKSYYTDADGDGYGDPASFLVETCLAGPPNSAPNNTDCDDNPGSGAPINPGSQEACADGIDNDCDTKNDCGDPNCAGPCAPMVAIPAGCFNMGSHDPTYTDYRPVHNVCITSAFDMDRHEATNAEYASCVAASACTPPTSLDSYTRSPYYGDPAYNNYPVIYVTWSQATDYCLWAGKRLPTEAEWEYAARGGLVNTYFPWVGGADGTKLNCYDIGDPWDLDTSPVEYFPPNGYGLYDMAGNVEEYVNDFYSGSYYQYCLDNGIVNDPPGPAGPLPAHAARGGGWNCNVVCSFVFARFGPWNDSSWLSQGIRCARD